jgi:hypothetical protein
MSGSAAEGQRSRWHPQGGGACTTLLLSPKQALYAIRVYPRLDDLVSRITKEKMDDLEVGRLYAQVVQDDILLVLRSYCSNNATSQRGKGVLHRSENCVRIGW